MISKLLKKLKRNKTVHESGMLFFAEGFGLMFSMLIVLVRPKFLAVEEIGLISYLVSLISFFSTFFSLGLDNTGARLVMYQTDNNTKHKISGMMLFIALVLTTVFSLFMIVVSFFIPYFGRSEAVSLLYLVIPFVGYNVLVVIYTQLCYALGAIKQAAIQLFIYPAIYFPLMLILVKVDVYSMKTAVFTEYSLHMLVILLPIILFERKNLKFKKELWPQIKKEHNEKGWKIYLSRILFLPSFNMDSLILGAFHPLESVAFYALSNTIARPITVIGQSVSQSMYRKFSSKNSVNTKRVIYLTLLTVFTAICGYIISIIVVKFFLGEEYYPMLLILPLAIIAASIRGITALYTSFMNAKGLANQVRNCAIVGLVGNIIFNFGLIIPFGALGGMLASIIVLAINLIMRMYYCSEYADGRSKI